MANTPKHTKSRKDLHAELEDLYQRKRDFDNRQGNPDSEEGRKLTNDINLMDDKLSKESDVTLKGGVFNTFWSYYQHKQQQQDRKDFASEFNDTRFMRDAFGRQNENNNEMGFVPGQE